MVAQTVGSILHRSFMDEAMRLRSHTSLPRHHQDWRLGVAMDGGEYGPSDHLCDAFVPLNYERDSVLYCGYVHQGKDH